MFHCFNIIDFPSNGLWIYVKLETFKDPDTVRCGDLGYNRAFR